MPPNRPETGASSQVSLREYWTKSKDQQTYHLSELRRRNVQSPSSPSLVEHLHTLPMRPGTSLPPGISQPALPLTWYEAEPAVSPATAETPYTVTQLQEKLEQRGVETLSHAELLSLVLRTGAGNESVVERIHTLLTSYSVRELLHVDFGEWCEQYGLSKAKAAQVQALLEVSQRLTHPSPTEQYTIQSPADAAMLVRPEMEFLDHEELRVLVLDTKNRVVTNTLMYKGTVNSSVLRAGEIFRPAVARKCPNLIVCHNHPSGDPTPSPEDIAVTEQLIEAGKVLDIELVDHLVIGHNNRFISLKERLRW